MKIQAITLMAALTGVAAAANEGTAERNVTVCMEGNAHSDVAIRAQWLASRMFAGIGVTIDWRHGLRGCPSQGIMISLSDGTPASLKPGALAYALPYEGTHIRVFYDRIAQDHDQRLVPALLGHVLVHEITHILQGVCRHSESGIMKAHWGLKEFEQMQGKPLEFADEDINLIYCGLAARARARARAVVAMNAPPAAVAAR